MFTNGSTAIECGGGRNAAAADCLEPNRRYSTSPQIAITMMATIASTTSFRFLSTLVEATRDQEGPTPPHQMRSLVRQSPLEPKVSFCPRLRAFGDDREEQFAVADLRADLLIPRIPAAQLA